MTDAPDPAREELLREELSRQDGPDPLRGSRTSGFWAAVIALGLILILLIIFIAQNTRQTTVSFLAWDGQVPVAVAILIAAVAGLFLAGLAGSLRILQLRRRVRRTNH
jgi:uncharacterized integral membrane protein